MNFVITITVLLLVFKQSATENLLNGPMCGVFSAKPETPKAPFQELLQRMVARNKPAPDYLRGHYAEIWEFPFIALIRSSRRSCMGSIISKRWILTAAHCLRNIKSEDIRVYVGITERSQVSYYPTPYHKVIEYIAHQSYDNKSLYSDIALLKLKKEISLDINRANSVCLPPARGFSIDRINPVTISGWDHNRLKITKIKLSDSNKEKLISTDVEYGDLRKGDSGGPLVQYWNGRAVQIGINRSTTAPKNSSKINSNEFTSVPYYSDWIIETIRINE